jgi:hypothetical protein
METKPSESEKVDKYMSSFKHPLKNILKLLREIILSTSKDIGEEIKWNAPSFFYSGPMEPSNPKDYKRYLAVSNVHAKDHIMLVFLHGANLDDGSGFLEGNYKDGRRLLRFYSLEDVKSKKKDLQRLIVSLLKSIN